MNNFERFKDLAEDSELPQNFKYQAALEFLRTAGFESPWFSFMANRPDQSINSSEHDVTQFCVPLIQEL